MKLSIVTSLFKSSHSVATFYVEATAVARDVAGPDYEIVFVNDGSPDDSLEQIVQLSAKDSHVVIVDLSRNFGHHQALMIGLEFSRGDLVFLIDSDLEENSEWLTTFSSALFGSGADVIYGYQMQRKGGLLERWSGIVYYWVLGHLFGIEHPPNIVTARLMTRRYVDSLLLHREREIVISGLWFITGFKQIGLCVEKKQVGSSTYSYSKRFSHAINTVTSFSARPLYGILYLGIIIFICSLFAILSLTAIRIFSIGSVPGWTSVLVSIWLASGLMSIMMGTLAIYMAKIYTEVKRRPLTIVKDVYANGHRQDQSTS